MTNEEFDAACEALMDALCDAGFTDASVGSSWNGAESMAMAEVHCITPDEVVKLTELIRRDTRAL